MTGAPFFMALLGSFIYNIEQIYPILVGYI